MTKKQFNREYFVRVRITSKVGRLIFAAYGARSNFLASYDDVLSILGDKADRVFLKVESACACKVVIKPYHGMELTFIAH